MGAVYYNAGELANRQYFLVWLICKGRWDVNFKIDGLTAKKAYTVGQRLE